MKNLLEIKKSLLKFHHFSEEHLNLFTDCLVYKKIRKKDFLLKPNQVSTGIAFITEGSFRFYRENETGELTMKFFTESLWVADLESLLLQQASKNYIQATEDSEIAWVTLKDIHKLMDSDPVFRMLNALLSDLAISASYLVTLHAKSPDERYKELLMTHPEWVNRFPQMQIASYLRITPETLSRVRARGV